MHPPAAFAALGGGRVAWLSGRIVSLVVEDIREMGKPPETPNPKPEREMGKREKKPRNQRGKWEKEENGKRKREGEPNGVTTPLPSSKNRDVLYAMG